MNQSELERELRMHGVSVKSRRDEVVVETCCFCGNSKFNLELSADKGVFHCWVCKRGGGLGEVLMQLTGNHYDLPRHSRRGKEAPKKATGEATLRTAPLALYPSAASYLERRGISLSTAAGYGMALCLEPDDDQGKKHPMRDRIVIPMYSFWGGELIGWVGRNYTGGQPKYISTFPEGGATVSGWRQQSSTPAPIVLVEGPFDGLAVHLAGFEAAVLTGSGMKSSALAEWAGRIAPPTPALVVFLDADATERSRKLYWQLQSICSVPVLEVRPPEGSDPGLLGPDWIRAELPVQISTPRVTMWGR